MEPSSARLLTPREDEDAEFAKRRVFPPRQRAFFVVDGSVEFALPTVKARRRTIAIHPLDE
jgi:hypothetical protein